MFVAAFDLPTVERPGGFETVNATGANFRRIIDLSNLDNSVWSNSPGQSGQPGSPYYADLRENLANGQYFPMLFSRGAVEGTRWPRLPPAADNPRSGRRTPRRRCHP
jgi:penicillin amidase